MPNVEDVVDAEAKGVEDALRLMATEVGFRLTLVGKLAAQVAGIAAARTLTGSLPSQEPVDVHLAVVRRVACRAALLALDDWNAIPMESLRRQWTDAAE